MSRFQPITRTMLAAAAVIVGACGRDGSTEPRGDSRIHVVQGAGDIDTISAVLEEPLVVEVRGRNGRPAVGVLVRFEAQPHGNPERAGDAAIHACLEFSPYCSSQLPFSEIPNDVTDSLGRAEILIQFGVVAGPAVMRIVVPELGISTSATYTVLAGAPARLRASLADTLLDIGGTVTVRGATADRFGNPRSDALEVSAGAGTAITVDRATGMATAVGMGTQNVLIRVGTLVDSTIVRVVPAGRLAVWSADSNAIRLVNLNGTDTRTVVTGVHSDYGTFPRFDAARQRISIQAGTSSSGTPTRVIVSDTTAAERREIGAWADFIVILAVRQMADGDVLVVGRRAPAPPGTPFYLWRVTRDSTVTPLAWLEGLETQYGAADISHDGTRVAYVAGDELRTLTVSTGAIRVLEPIARTPRWSLQGDRVAFLIPLPTNCCNLQDGHAVVINADGTGRRPLGTTVFSPGLSWSPDGTYLVGRTHSAHMKIIRVSDTAEVRIRFRSATGVGQDYYQPDWR